jgi:hypothetical protein
MADPDTTIVIHDTTPAEAAAIIEILGGEARVFADDDADGITLGHPYHRSDGVYAVADALEAKAPGSTWEVWSGPFEGDLGCLVRWAPGLGRFTGSCDGEGVLYFGGPQLAELVYLDAAVAARTIGEPWADWIAALGAREGEVVAPAPAGPPPVDVAARAALAEDMHGVMCPTVAAGQRCARGHRDQYARLADAVIAAGWRPWADHPGS